MRDVIEECVLKLMVEIIGEISKEAYCSPWNLGIEDRLLEMVNNGDRSIGQIDVDEDILTLLAGLSEFVGGWVYKLDKDNA